MTNGCARANEETRPIEPVKDWENQRNKGMILSGDGLFEQSIGEIEDARARQRAYLDSLPTDPTDIIKEARRTLQPNASSYPDGFEDALHLSWAMEAILKNGQLEDVGPERDAALYIAAKMTDGLLKTARALDHLGSALDGPRREEERQRCQR